ncbi:MULTISPECIES: TIGR02680 family protein [unclassified Streptomyces]|uniref:TIGR02680 family protein n=1 Tax=unclassified Streptomyces TaxID=2593676 RepID=UPI002E18AF43|nr:MULTISPECIES: TIGR02680 family protein [unclassified Streptomyces]
MTDPADPAAAQPLKDLPEPAPGRWKPLRIGLVDLFYYDDEEFWFRDGRLLLRGNNGTGKSKVLALTLPFLLDGDLSARRVEPDGDPHKRMEWNLLLGGEHPHSERLGYTWIEFGRVDETTGEAHFRTLLCGLKAVAGRGIARHWFAVTDQRVGRDLNLLDATRTALSRERLAEAVAGRGMVHDTAKAYRRAVDEALFGLGEQRYTALVDLLVQLRQPQLSKRPNEAALSRALTEALPPMDQAVVADVAEAFRSLDEEKDELRAAGEAERAATAFLDHYRRYARVASRRRARLPREEHVRYETLNRDLNRHQAEKAAAETDREAASERLAELDETAARLAAQDTALREGPEMRDARALEQAAADAHRTAAGAAQVARDRAEAEALHQRAIERENAAAGRLRAVEERVAETLSRATDTARAARITTDIRVDGAPLAELRKAAEGEVERRHRTVAHVDALATRAEEASAERLAAAHRADETEEEVTHTAELRAEADAAAEDRGRDLVQAVRGHLAVCTELTVDDQTGMLDRLQDWTGHLNGPSPARAAAGAAQRVRAAELADAAAGNAQREAALRSAEAELRREHQQLEAGGQRGPSAPYTRGDGVRDGRQGAPLWRLVDFRDDSADASALDADARAGLEAALEASGLLDAWVLPDGSAMTTVDTEDVLVRASTPLAGPTLADVLRPAIDHADAGATALSEAAVDRLLRSIALDARAIEDSAESAGVHTAVSADGRFRVGALTGRWTKPTAAYVGEGAREAARRARIAVVVTELEQTREQLSRVEEAGRRVQARRRTLDTELAALPDDAALRQAYAHAGTAAAAARRAGERHAEQARRLARVIEYAEVAARELDYTAADLGLPADREGLDAVRQGLTGHALVLAALWPELRERGEAASALAEERAEAGQAAERAGAFASRAEEAARLAAAADERHLTLRSTVGAAVADLERRLAETADALRTCADDERVAREAHTAAQRLADKAEGRIEQLQEDITAATAQRADAIAAFQRFVGTGLLIVALPELDVPDQHSGPWAPTPAIALARAVEQELGSVDSSDGAWERVQKRLNEEYKALQDALSRHGHSASARMVEDGMVVDIVYQGRERAVPALAEALTAEVAELQRILSAHEREILETYLLTEVAGTLQELIGAAERQVVAMNAELEDRPTSTGMRLRLVWRPSRKAPAGLARARELLRQSADAWSTEDRAAVGEFLQTQIAAQQEGDSAGSWLEYLTEALDYRSWHEFGIERHQHGKWVPATGPASGGERVLAVSVPLFAAASSHYQTASNPHAPRLVTLDEAFAGVDDDSRAKCLGLLHAFDLDVVMTSEREWACYPQVPGVAIAQLSRIDEVAAVLVSRWEWNGARRERGPDPRAALIPVVPGPRTVPGGLDTAEHGSGPAGTADSEAAQETLWN